MKLGFFRRLRVFDAVGCLLAVAYGTPSVWYPFGNDQALHWYLGDGILRGDLPYVTGISGKPPGIFLVHALAIVLFGDTQAAIRILEVLPVSGPEVVTRSRYLFNRADLERLQRNVD